MPEDKVIFRDVQIPQTGNVYTLGSNPQVIQVRLSPEIIALREAATQREHDDLLDYLTGLSSGVDLDTVSITRYLPGGIYVQADSEEKTDEVFRELMSAYVDVVHAVGFTIVQPLSPAVRSSIWQPFRLRSVHKLTRRQADDRMKTVGAAVKSELQGTPNKTKEIVRRAKISDAILQPIERLANVLKIVAPAAVAAAMYMGCISIQIPKPDLAQPARTEIVTTAPTTIVNVAGTTPIVIYTCSPEQALQYGEHPEPREAPKQTVKPSKTKPKRSQSGAKPSMKDSAQPVRVRRPMKL